MDGDGRPSSVGAVQGSEEEESTYGSIVVPDLGKPQIQIFLKEVLFFFALISLEISSNKSLVKPFVLKIKFFIM